MPDIDPPHTAAPSIVHYCPRDFDNGLMPCCGKTPFEVPLTDRMTVQKELVTCGKR